jgi:hypothetical protein
MPNPDWKPGCASPNPAGRPKKERSVTALLEQRTDRARLVDALLELAYDGDLAAIWLVLERLDGLPPSHVEQQQAWAGDERQVRAYEHELIAMCGAATPSGGIDGVALITAIVDGQLPEQQARLVSQSCDPALVADAAARLTAQIEGFARRELARRNRSQEAAEVAELEQPWREAVEATTVDANLVGAAA